MQRMLILSCLIVLIAMPAVAKVADIDGVLCELEGIASVMPANTIPGPLGRVVDIVGSTASPASNSGRAKGNAYRIDTDATLNKMEFYLNFSDTQTLIYYVFEGPVEMGTYTEVYRFEESVTGAGAAWYASPDISIPLEAGTYYILAVSFSGYMTYYYETADEWATSFGAAVHGYAVGYHPLPSSFTSDVNDQACYYQRITTNYTTPVSDSSWGRVKALF